ncbi:MAG: SMP-30/gluconolactonase/LRE family protein, partial [Vicinamibacterales bacterium]
GAGGAPAAGAAAAPAGPRDVTITAIPGIIAANAKWVQVWQGPGNNSDGGVALADGSLLIAQEDASTILKIDKNDATSIYLADTHGAGSLSIDAQGRIFAVQRMPNGVGATAPGAATMAGIAILHPSAERKVLSNTFSDGTPWTGRPNDLAADGKGGAYFTQGCVYYAGPDGRIKLVGEDLRTNGIVLNPDGKTLYVTNGGTLAALDVQPDGSLKNKRDFETGGMGGDGLAVDTAGNIYISGGTDIKVVSPQGKPLGLIPTPRNTISVAFGGADRKTMYIIANGASDAFGTAVAGPNQPAFAAWRTIYKIQMLSAGLKTRGK